MEKEITKHRIGTTHKHEPSVMCSICGRYEVLISTSIAKGYVRVFGRCCNHECNTTHHADLEMEDSTQISNEKLAEMKVNVIVSF